MFYIYINIHLSLHPSNQGFSTAALLTILCIVRCLAASLPPPTTAVMLNMSLDIAKRPLRGAKSHRPPRTIALDSYLPIYLYIYFSQSHLNFCFYICVQAKLATSCLRLYEFQVALNSGKPWKIFKTNSQKCVNISKHFPTPKTVCKLILWYLFKFLRYLQIWISKSSIPLNYEWKFLPQGKHAWNKIKTVVRLATAFCWQVSLAVTLKFIPAIQFRLQAKKVSRRTQKKEDKVKQAKKTVAKCFPSQQCIFSRCLRWWRWGACVCKTL